MKQATFLLCLVMPLSAACGQQYSAAQLKYFETNIRPALVKYCYDCHSVDAGDSRAGLLVDTRQGLMQGGDSGPAIVPGNHADSLLWDAINWDGYEMPPSEKMPAAVIAKFKTWIDMGAPDPRVREALEFKTKITKDDIRQGRSHWSFQRPQAEPGEDIDSLVAAQLKDSGVQPTGQADPYTLLRRINFDLVGLPPAPAEIEAFVKAFKASPDAAVASKVDELLAREQFGERWGRHWLDVARYAESSGSRNVSYPHAWRYRDYVIDSFNNNTPYDTFIKEQIAGDLLPARTDEQWQKNLIATGFLAIGMKHHDEKNPRKFMSDMVDEQIDTTTQAVLGLTVACARCHDHKYDPIPTDDYYRLAGIFYSTKTLYGTTRIGQNHRPSDLLLLPMQNESSSAGRNSRNSMASVQQRIDDLDRQMRNVTGKDRRGLRNARNRLASQLQALNPDGTAKAFGMGVQENEEMINASILLGGEVEKPAQEVPRGFVQILGDLDFTVRSRSESGRLELAESLTSRRNPLTARVMMNRVWMHLLGSPLVETTSNFGLSGTEPTHPQLLDHLAVRFMEEDWDLKAMIRQIVLTQTYRRSSQYIARNYEEDPDNKLLWRANPRQVDAEALRDAMLALSGQLNPQRPVASAVANIGGRPGSANLSAGNNHRSVYLPVVRDNLPESLDLFDFPDPNMTSTGRGDSIVPTQALYLMNGEFVKDQAASMAAGLQRQTTNREQQIRTAFLWAYSRPPSSDELQASAAFFREYVPTGASGGMSIQPAAGARRGRPGQAGPRGGGAARGMGARGMGARDAGGAREAGADMQRGGQGRRPGAARAGGRGQRGPAETPSVAATGDQALAVFCQTLMASARFRILN